MEREKSVQEQAKQQPVPVKMYRTHKRFMIATPMAGLEPENILVLPISTPDISPHLTLERVTPTHGEHRGNAGHLATCVSLMYEKGNLG